MEDLPSPDSFFKARNAYDTALFYGDLNLTANACAVFRYLLENVMYRPKEEADYGYVARAALGENVISKVTCMSGISVRRAIKDLEDRKMLRRVQRPRLKGGRHPDDIQVIWLTEGI